MSPLSCFVYTRVQRFLVSPTTLPPSQAPSTMLHTESTTAGISKLLPDVLAMVFEPCALRKDIMEKDSTSPPSYVTALISSTRAVRLSHVCHHWRAVALDTTSLWISPSFTYRHDGMDFHILGRARHSPLRLSITDQHTPERYTTE
jgi:hypothetical protein